MVAPPPPPPPDDHGVTATQRGAAIAAIAGAAGVDVGLIHLDIQELYGYEIDRGRALILTFEIRAADAADAYSYLLALAPRIVTPEACNSLLAAAALPPVLERATPTTEVLKVAAPNAPPALGGAFPPPLPPPPPSPPPPLVTTTFSLGGSPSDYGTAEIDSIKQVLATAAGVAVSAVALTLTAGSVIVTATIEVDDASMAASTASALSTGILASASALETALQDQFAADGLSTAVTVAAIVNAPSVEAPSEELAAAGAGSNVAGIVVGVIFSLLLLIGGGVGFVWWRRRRGKAPPSLGGPQPVVKRLEDVRRWWQAQRAKRGGKGGKGGQYTSSTSAVEAESSAVGVEMDVERMARDSKPAPPRPSLWKSSSSLDDVDVDVEPVEVAVKAPAPPLDTAKGVNS